MAFYCEPCREANSWFGIIPTSYGKCEFCGKTAPCHDRKLPERPKPPQTWTLPAEPGPEVTHLRDRYRTVWTRMGGKTWGHANFDKRTPTLPWDLLFVRCYPLTDVSAEYSIDNDNPGGLAW